jgi:hypothetical protein
MIMFLLSRLAAGENATKKTAGGVATCGDLLVSEFYRSKPGLNQ